MTKDNLITLLLGISLTVGVAFIFYRSVYALALGIVVIPFYYRYRSASLGAKRQRQLRQQFISAMQMVGSALAAGYSIENAWRQAQKDMEKLYGTKAVMYREMAEMNRKVRMNEPLEELFMKFADRSEVEDIGNFAEIFQYAKRSGGNLSAILQKTIQSMRDKADILAEIENSIAARKAEQKVMNFMVPMILVFITASSPQYVTILYGNMIGVLLMTICLAGYAAACFWSAKLTDIRV